jgi:hypothetical protein
VPIENSKAMVSGAHKALFDAEKELMKVKKRIKLKSSTGGGSSGDATRPQAEITEADKKQAETELNKAMEAFSKNEGKPEDCKTPLGHGLFGDISDWWTIDKKKAAVRELKGKLQTLMGDKLRAIAMQVLPTTTLLPSPVLLIHPQ